MPGVVKNLLYPPQGGIELSERLSGENHYSCNTEQFKEAPRKYLGRAQTQSMIILHPPLTKPCEPPAALGYLGSALESHGQSCALCDMNIEGLHYIFKTTKPADDTWSKRAFKHLDRNISALQDKQTYYNIDRYRRAVSDINRVLEIAGRDFDIQLTLANYQDNTRSPLKSEDLLNAAANFEANIFFPYFSKRLDSLLAGKTSVYIGISLNYLSQALCSFAIAGYLKARHPNVTIIMGGGLVTTWLSHPQYHNRFGQLIDHFFGGRGEEPLLKILGKAPGPVCTKPEFAPLRSNDYLTPGFVLPYATSFGCFWKRCSFCPERSEDNPYQHNTPATTVTDLQSLVKATSPSLIHLLDNAISPATLKAIVTSAALGPWYGFVRFDAPLNDLEFCRKLRLSGCVMLKLGLESGDQEVLNRMDKGINLHLVSTILRNLQEVGISTYVYLLFGTPAENRKKAEHTLSFVEEHRQGISFLNLAIFNLPLCSGEITGLDVSNFYEGDLSLYRNFSHPNGWDRGEVRRFLDTTFKRSPGIAAILRRDPPFFTSNHAPFIK